MGLLRLFLALSVVIAHAAPIPGFPTLNAADAVKFFYVISGFYMALVLSTNYTTFADLRAFYTNRFLRLYPSYFIMLVPSAIILIMVSPALVAEFKARMVQ